MKLDDLIQETTKALAKLKHSNLALNYMLDQLKSSVAIKVNTKAEADIMLEVFKTELFDFPYPFGPYLCWIEIPVEGRESICYSVMAPYEEWPHWQIYLNPQDTARGGQFIWSASGRVGPRIDLPGGQAIGPTVFAHQDVRYCKGCKHFGAEPDFVKVHKMTPVDKSISSATRDLWGGLCCAFTWGRDTRCQHSAAFWDAAILPVSIIMYIAVAPTHELDGSWHPRRILGKGTNQRTKVGYYHLTPVRKVYIEKRIGRFWTGEGRKLEVPSFVRGHHRRAHKRFLSWRGKYTNVRESWVNPHWRGPELEELPPHYSLNWGPDKRLVSVERLVGQGDSGVAQR